MQANKNGFRVAAALAGVLALSGCEEGGGFALPFGQGGGGAGDAAPSSVRLVERDVEAPDVFQVTEPGLWDGRPSLGGVWVAHPDVQEPERVIIRNSQNGQFVIGALFRKERETPGPRLQISSDAADALDVLAGAPTTLNVTALRREEVSEPAATDGTGESADAPTAGAAAPVEIAATPLAPSAPADPAATAPEATAAPAPAAAAAATAPPARASAESPLGRPYIQLGIFSVEENATRTADNLREIGIVPTVLAEESRGRDFWRVIVGPARSAAERDELLAQVRALGFEDAYFVSD